MKKILVLASLVAILFAGKVHAQTGDPGFSIYNFNSASGVQISLWAAGGAVSTIKVDADHFLTGSPQGNVQLKPNVNTDAVQYVSKSGSDANDGLSWGTAKKSIFAALQALPGGSTRPPTAGRGTVYFAGGVTHPKALCGIWIMGPADPNFASPPSCWLRENNNGAVGINIVGSPNFQGGPNVHSISVFPNNTGGIGNNGGVPGIWLSNTTVPINISGLTISGGNNAFKIGICSNGDRTGTCV